MPGKVGEFDKDWRMVILSCMMQPSETLSVAINYLVG